MSKLRRLLLPTLLLLAAGCSPVYVLRAGFAEASILSRRRPIAQVIADPATRPQTRHKLQVVERARTFAQKALGLRVGDSYTTYSRVDSDTLAMVLQAAPELELREYTWWFPIVGRVPYKGYFSLSQAQAAARELESRGYDTYLRPTTAFSTLGWFNDPLLSTVIEYDDEDLVDTVIHELTHNTLFVPSHVSFNESFANFVGAHGAIDYFCSLEGEGGSGCQTARDRWHDELLFGDFLSDLVRRLEAVYARTDLPASRRLALREDVFRQARQRWASDFEPKLATDRYRGFGKYAILNNASIIARRLYYDRLGVFEAAFQRLGGDLPATIRAVKAAANGAKDPYAAVASITAAPRGS